MTTTNYSLKEARAIASEYCEATGTDENVIRGYVPGDALDEWCERMLKAIDEIGNKVQNNGQPRQ